MSLSDNCCDERPASHKNVALYSRPPLSTQSLSGNAVRADRRSCLGSIRNTEGAILRSKFIYNGQLRRRAPPSGVHSPIPTPNPRSPVLSRNRPSSAALRRHNRATNTSREMPNLWRSSSSSSTETWVFLPFMSCLSALSVKSNKGDNPS